MTVYDRIKELADKKRVSLRQVAFDLGLGETYLYQLRKKTPNGANLEKLADYFNVSVDYLLGRDDAKPVNEQIVDIAELANKPKDFDWDKVLSAGGKPITEQDKEIIRRLFADKLAD